MAGIHRDGTVPPVLSINFRRRKDRPAVPVEALPKAKDGCPFDVIAQILGHDNLDVTAHYAQVSTGLMMDTYKRAYPDAKT